MSIYISKPADQPVSTRQEPALSSAANSDFKAIIGEFKAPDNETAQPSVTQSSDLPSPPVPSKNTVAKITQHTQNNLSWQIYYHSGRHFQPGERFTIPKVLPSYSEAARALAPGGPYSVEAVSSCVLSMAAQVAQGNPEKIAEIRHEIEKAVAIFRMSYKAATKEKDLPQICLDTYDAIMEGLDKLEREYATNNEAAPISA